MPRAVALVLSDSCRKHEYRLSIGHAADKSSIDCEIHSTGFRAVLASTTFDPDCGIADHRIDFSASMRSTVGKLSQQVCRCPRLAGESASRLQQRLTYHEKRKRAEPFRSMGPTCGKFDVVRRSRYPGCAIALLQKNVLIVPGEEIASRSSRTQQGQKFECRAEGSSFGHSDSRAAVGRQLPKCSPALR